MTALARPSEEVTYLMRLASGSPSFPYHTVIAAVQFSFRPTGRCAAVETARAVR